MQRLELFNRNKSEFLRPYVTMDETWLIISHRSPIDSQPSEVIEETEAYFEAKDKSYYKNGIEKLYDRYNRCITREGNYIE